MLQKGIPEVYENSDLFSLCRGVREVGNFGLARDVLAWLARVVTVLDLFSSGQRVNGVSEKVLEFFKVAI